MGYMSRVHAAGFNAHGQLDRRARGDLRRFQPLSDITRDDFRVLFTCWSTTVLLFKDRIIGIGHQRFDRELDVELSASITTAFGNEDGMRGCLDAHGQLLLLHAESSSDEDLLRPQNEGEGMLRYEHLVLAGNGKIAAALRGAPDAHSHDIVEFDGLEGCVSWSRHPDDLTVCPTKCFAIPRRPMQLLAGAATFLLLTEDGEVYSWGDSRFQSLGRAVRNADTVPVERTQTAGAWPWPAVDSIAIDRAVAPAAQPGLVDALEGVAIEKIATGGWMSAALSRDGALYVWGTGLPGSNSIACLRETDGGALALIDLSGEDGEPLDIQDVAIGDGHIVVVTEGDQLFAAGENSNGQLGVDSDARFLAEWTKAEESSQTRSVLCGPKCTFRLTV